MIKKKRKKKRKKKSKQNNTILYNNIQYKLAQSRGKQIYIVKFKQNKY